MKYMAGFKVWLEKDVFGHEIDPMDLTEKQYDELERAYEEEMQDKLIKAMEKAEKVIATIAEKHDLYFDDCEWGNANHPCFKIKLWHDYFKKLGGFNRPVPKLEKEMVFIYDPDDVWERTFDEQVDAAIVNFVEENF